MASWILYLFMLIFGYNEAADLMAKNVDNYGPYTVNWENYGTCRGPKKIDMCSSIPGLIKQSDGKYRYLLNFTMFENVHIEEIRMVVSTVKGNKKTILFNYNVNKPCQHYMLAAMLETYFGAKNCWLKKGDYYADLPMTTLMENYLGDSFFYGDYFFKVSISSKNANLCCLVFDPKFKKKIKQ